jgi:sulfite reductase (NADPH) hemoprotein beta-component
MGRIFVGREDMPEQGNVTGDLPGVSTATEIREILALARGATVGPRHSFVFHGLGERERNELEARGIIWYDSADVGGMRVLTCVAKPTCPFALMETERAYAEWAESASKNRELLEKARSKDRKGGQFTLAISGCPHGCAQSLTADLGIVAEGPGRFRIYEGGNGVQLGTMGRQISGPDELGMGFSAE